MGEGTRYVAGMQTLTTGYDAIDQPAVFGGGHYSLVNNIRGGGGVDNFWGEQYSLLHWCRSEYCPPSVNDVPHRRKL